MQAVLRTCRSLTRSPLRRAFSIAGAALAVVLWLALAPTALGGSSTYVTTYGISMEPTLHRGDLAIVRSQPSYHVGDVVAYRSVSLHTTVLHRIIGRDGDRYIFKGDNNTWIDTDHPLASDLIGAMAVKVPGLGTHVQQVASPTGVGALSAAAALPITWQGRRRRRRDNDQKPSAPTRGKAGAALAQPAWRHVEPRLLIVTALAAGLAFVSFTRPPTNHVTSDLPFDDHGEFTYSGAAPGGEAVYQGNTVSSGQPVFFNLVHAVDVGFTYDVASTVPLIARGDVALTGQLSDADGWTYPVPVAAPVGFENSRATTSGTLDLDALRSIVSNMEDATGVKRDNYTLLVTAAVNRDVRGNGATVTGAFTSSLEFKLDATELHLAAPGVGVLTPSQGGLLSVPRVADNHFDLLGQSPSIAALRAIALAFGLIVIALWVDTLMRSTGADEVSLIDRRYRNYLLPVRAVELPSEIRIDVESITALARVADHSGAPMLRGRTGAYYVVDGPRLYRYLVRPLHATRLGDR